MRKIILIAGTLVAALVMLLVYRGRPERESLTESRSQAADAQAGRTARSTTTNRAPIPRLKLPEAWQNRPLNPKLSNRERRPSETDVRYALRQRFLAEYEQFVTEAALSPDQNKQLDVLLAQVQVLVAEASERARKRTVDKMVESARTGRPVDHAAITAQESLEREEIQKTLDERMAEILTPEQRKLLGRNYAAIKSVPGFGSKPFDLDS